MFGGGNTVFDRAKKTGFITGSRHSMMSPMMDTASGDEAETPEAGSPPNLRDADGPNSCGDCEYFMMGGGDDSNGPGVGGQCNKFNGFSVTPNQTCDAFEAKGESDNGEETGPSPQGQADAQARP